jgi:hypothetical protein
VKVNNKAWFFYYKSLRLIHEHCNEYKNKTEKRVDRESGRGVGVGSGGLRSRIVKRGRDVGGGSGGGAFEVQEIHN